MNVPDSRERILDAALDLFLAGTFHNVGVTEICKAAGVNKGTLYHFFKSKTDVLIATLVRYTESVAIDYERVAKGVSEPEKRLQGFFAVAKLNNARYVIEKGFCPGCFIGNVSSEQSATDDRVNARAQWAMDRLTAIFEPSVAEVLADAGLDTENRKIAATALMALLQGTQVLAKLRNDTSVFDLAARSAVDVVLAAARPAGLDGTGDDDTERPSPSPRKPLGHAQ